MPTSTLSGNGRVVNTKRYGPLAQAIDTLSGRVNRLEETGVNPQPAGELTQEAHEFVDALKRGTDKLHKLEAQVKELEANKPQVIELRTPKGDTRKIDGVTHPVFAEVVELAHARDNIFGCRLVSTY